MKYFFVLSEKEIKDIIINSLYRNELISKELFVKCNQAVSELPYDLRTTDIDELSERLDAIDEEIKSREDILAKADYRIGVKKRDIDRLVKRLDKHQANMDKAEEGIAKESDKIVKDIGKLEKKLDKVDWGDEKDLRDSVYGRLDKFKHAHNDLFDMELTPKNIKTYQGQVDKFEARSVELHNILVDLYNGGVINKTDLNNGDISKSITRLNKHITKYDKANKDITKDSQKIQDDIVDVNYISNNSINVVNSMYALDDEADRTLNRYLELGGDRRPKPGISQDGKGTNVPDFIEEMNKLQKDLGKKYPYHFT